MARKTTTEEFPGQDPAQKAAVEKQVAEAKAVGDKVRAGKTPVVKMPKSKAAAKGATVATEEGVIIAEQRHIEALQAEADAEVAAEAAAVVAQEEGPLPEPTPISKGRSTVLITLPQRNRLVADESAPKALVDAALAGVEVRQSNGQERPASIPVIEPRYFPRWRVRLSLTPKQVADLATWLDATPEALQTETGTGKVRGAAKPSTSPEAVALAEAKALVAKVDAMPASEAKAIFGSDEVQHALELVGKASTASRREARFN